MTSNGTSLPLLTHWVDGRPSTAVPERVGDVFDPSTGRVVRQVAFASPGDVDDAVDVARRAFAAWGTTSLATRMKVLFRFRELLARGAEELASLITAEHGKVAPDALGEVHRGLEAVEFACGVPGLLRGGFSEGVSSGTDVHSVRQPLGVVAVISPFNFPAMVPCWFFPLAVATGNTVILKPSEKDPSAANWIAERWAEAGLPDGVFNVVHGDRVAVDRLLGHPDVKAVSFVGSTPVARHVYETATSSGKRVQALGGAKNHMVVLPDADLHHAARSAVNAGFGSAGERCMAISVLVAVGSIADRLVAAVADRIGDLTVGDGRDRPFHGDQGGFWLGPTLFDHVTPEMALYTDEIFGPVLSVVRVPSLDEALALVNANPYGNGAAIFTADGGAARRFQQEVEVGMVGINVPIPVPVAYYSFGGWKSSLFGDTHAHGTEGVHFFTRGKVVTSQWPEGGGGRADLAFPRNQ